MLNLIGCIFVSSLCARSYWKTDIWTTGPLTEISGEQWFVVGKPGREQSAFSHEAGPSTKGGVLGCLWLMFTGDLESDGGFGFDSFIVSWRATGEFPYWFVVVPLWPLVFLTACLPLLSVLSRWFPCSTRPRGKQRFHVWPAIYLPSLLLLMYAWSLEDRYGFGSPESARRDLVIRCSIYCLGIIIVAYAWRLIRFWNPLAVPVARGFEPLPQSQ